nr:glutaminyl-peptide cyclotransferase-like isoform X1 [Ipomoea batatas]
MFSPATTICEARAVAVRFSLGFETGGEDFNSREGLLASGAKDIDVLNGIAWDRDGGRIFGKMACNSATKFLGDAGICLFSLHVDDLAMSASDPAAQEIGQRFRETILALGGGKASLEVEIGTWLLDIDFWTLHPLTNTKDAN